MGRVIVFVIACALVAPTCSDGRSPDPERDKSLGPTSRSGSLATTADGAASGGREGDDREAEVIEGIVVEVVVGEGTLTLEDPERGYRIVKLEPGAELFHVDGTVADLAEHIATGSAIRASGRPGPSGEILLARRVQILGDE